MSLNSRTIAFTDPQGATFAAAVFAVVWANYNGNTDERITRNTTDFVLNSVEVNTNQNIAVQFYYWIDQNSIDTQEMPYILANTQTDANGNVTQTTMSFTFNPASSEYQGLTPEFDTLSLEDKCLYHLEFVIIPRLAALRLG